MCEIFQELIWFRRLSQSFNGVSDVVTKGNASLLCSDGPSPKNVAFKSKLTERGDKAFCVSILRFPQAVCHFCKKHSRFPPPGSTAGSDERCG